MTVVSFLVFTKVKIRLTYCKRTERCLTGPAFTLEKTASSIRSWLRILRYRCPKSVYGLGYA